MPCVTRSDCFQCSHFGSCVEWRFLLTQSLKTACAAINNLAYSHIYIALFINFYGLVRSNQHCLATSPVDHRNDMFHPRFSHQLRLGQVIRSNHFGRSPSINILILLRLNLLCRTAWEHFILVPIRHWLFTGRKRVAGTRTQNAAMLGSTGLVVKQWRTAGRASIYLIIKDNYYGWMISSSPSSSQTLN